MIDTLRQALKREPFEPFTICLADGQLVPVPHPEFVWIPPNQQRRFHVAEVTRDGQDVVNLSLVTSLKYSGMAEAGESEA